MHEPALPFASSLCGACAEVCPVKIDIPKMLLDLRRDVKKAEARDGQGKLERLAFRAFAWLMRHPRLYEIAGMAAASIAPESSNGYIRSAPPLLDHRTDSQMAHAARSSSARAQAVPPVVARAAKILMSRDNILHKVRTALGRSAGQPPPPAPPVRLSIPSVSMDAKIASFRERLEALAGKTHLAASPEDACDYVRRVINGRDAVASNAPFLTGLRHHAASLRALRRDRSRGVARALRDPRRRNHQRRLLPCRHRQPGDDRQPARKRV